jgi:hypothetical protein
MVRAAALLFALCAGCGAPPGETTEDLSELLLSGGRLDFGERVIGQVEERQPKLTNSGSVPLNEVDVQVTGSAAFSVVAVQPTVESGDSLPVTVRFQPQEAGNHRGALIIWAEGLPVLEVMLAGRARYPD